MKLWFRYALFLAFYRALTLLPKAWVGAAAGVLARLSVAAGVRRRIVLRNLEIAFGLDRGPQELARLYRDSMRASWLTIIEILWMARRDREWVRQRAAITGWEHVERALAQGRGALLLGAHFGNYELHSAVLALAARGHCYSYTGRQRNPHFENFMLRVRVRAGIQPISQGPEATRKMIRLLKDNRIVGICADQNARRAPIFVPFFGKLAAVPEGMATLAVKLDCPVLFSWIEREQPFQHRVVITTLSYPRSGSLRQDGEALAKVYLEQLERVVRAHPADYQWVQQRYRTRPAADPRPVYE